MTWDVPREEQAELGYIEEDKRLGKFAIEFLKVAKPGALYTFRLGTMDFYSPILRKDFEHYSRPFTADPTLAMIFLGRPRRRWKKGPRSIQFLATNVDGDVATVWMDEEALGALCEFKR